MKIEDAVKGLGPHLVSRMAILVAMSLPAALLFAQVEDAPGIGVQILEDASVVLPDPAPERDVPLRRRRQSGAGRGEALWGDDAR